MLIYMNTKIKTKYKSFKSSMVSPKTFLWNHLYEDIATLQKNITPKPKKVSQEQFEILNFKDYKLILEKNHNVSQLKKMCKKYKQRVSGNKTQLKKLLYNFLKYSYYSLKIQRLFRSYLLRKANKLRGSALIERNKCINETDFLTLEPIKDIPYSQFVSFKDKNNFIYGFNISSIYNLLKHAPLHKNIHNPYNRDKLPKIKLLNKINTIIRISKIFNMCVDTGFNTTQEEISQEKKIKFKTIELFSKIDEYGGFITNIEWFLKLNRIKLCKLIKELADVWNYRLQIPLEQKQRICPSSNPFFGFSQQLYINKPYHILQNKILKILNIFVTHGVDAEARKLGCYYVVGSLTLVSEEAAESCPWLFSAFFY